MFKVLLQPERFMTVDFRENGTVYSKPAVTGKTGGRDEKLILEVVGGLCAGNFMSKRPSEAGNAHKVSTGLYTALINTDTVPPKILNELLFSVLPSMSNFSRPISNDILQH